MNDFETVRLVIEMVVALFVTPLALILWWMLRSVIKDVRDMQKEHAEYKLHVAETYVKNQDLDRLEGKIDQIFDKLDRKVDK